MTADTLAPPMTSPTNQIDQKLDEWGSRLFNVSTETLPRPRRSTRSPLGSGKPVSTGGRLSAPQVMVEFVRAPKGMKGISNNLTYISRDVGMPTAADSTMRDAFHLVFSMPERTIRSHPER